MRAPSTPLFIHPYVSPLKGGTLLHPSIFGSIIFKMGFKGSRGQVRINFGEMIFA